MEGGDTTRVIKGEKGWAGETRGQNSVECEMGAAHEIMKGEDIRTGKLVVVRE